MLSLANIFRKARNLTSNVWWHLSSKLSCFKNKFCIVFWLLGNLISRISFDFHGKLDVKRYPRDRTLGPIINLGRCWPVNYCVVRQAAGPLESHIQHFEIYIQWFEHHLLWSTQFECSSFRLHGIFKSEKLLLFWKVPMKSQDSQAGFRINAGVAVFGKPFIVRYCRWVRVLAFKYLWTLTSIQR